MTFSQKYDSLVIRNTLRAYFIEIMTVKTNIAFENYD